METDNPQINSITKILCGELFKALGFRREGRLSKILSPLVWRPIQRFSEIVIGFDNRVEQLGFQAASQWIMPNFAAKMVASGIMTIPTTGPLLVASNHPGAYDTLVITSNLPRDDIKIVVNIPLDFISELPSTLPHFFYAPPDPHIRMNVVRSALKHLKSGGALLLFASGRIDPDPASMPGAEHEFDCWSRSLEIFLRRVPNTSLLITIVSGILTPKYVNHFFTRFRKERPDKQRISEFFQVMNQMITPGKFHQLPRVSFSKPIPYRDLIGMKDTNHLMNGVTKHAKSLLKSHLTGV